jgi:hypothetical protein
MPCYFLWTVGLKYIKKGLASLPMQLGSCVFKAYMHVPYAPDARAIMGLQDVRTGGTIITCKMCEQDDYNAAIVPRRPCWPLAGHCYSTRRPYRAVPYREPGVPHAVEDNICLLLTIGRQPPRATCQTPGLHVTTQPYAIKGSRQPLI